MHSFKPKTDFAGTSSGWGFGLNEWISLQIFKRVES